MPKGVREEDLQDIQDQISLAVKAALTHKDIKYIYSIDWTDLMIFSASFLIHFSALRIGKDKEK